MLKLYEKGIGVMKTRHEGDPTSFNFQWYTHWTPGKESDDVTKNEIIAKLPASLRPAAQTMWNTCQGHGMEGRDHLLFLPWHRMQLYYLEEIVRAACGDARFVMPYRKYLESEKEAVLPAPIRDPSSPLNNPNRRPPGHPGSGVNIGEWVPDAQVNYECLRLPTYYSTDAVQTNFSSSINNNPHGIMHDQIGNPYASDPLKYGMSFIPTAAGDPIFFLHHCNIDRLWASWNAAGNRNPDGDPSWAGKQFTFATPDGKTALYTVGKYTNIAALGYSYEKLEPIPGGKVAVVLTAPTPARAVTIGARHRVSSSAEPRRCFLLTPPPGGQVGVAGCYDRRRQDLSRDPRAEGRPAAGRAIRHLSRRAERRERQRAQALLCRHAELLRGRGHARHGTGFHVRCEHRRRQPEAGGQPRAADHHRAQGRRADRRLEPIDGQGVAGQSVASS